jgi:DNA-binding MarR family transcriptional regulator
MEVSGAGGTGAAEAAVTGGGEAAELEILTRALIGINLESLEVPGGQVSLPQFRLLLAASRLGRAPSSRLAEAAGVPASSVTRLADRLEAAGLLARGGDARSPSIVTIEGTAAGRARVVAEAGHGRGSGTGRPERAGRAGCGCTRAAPGDSRSSRRVGGPR